MKSKRLKMKIALSILSLAAVVLSFMQCSGSKKQDDPKKTIQDIVASMSLEQKARLVVGTGMFFDLPDSLEKIFKWKVEESTDTNYKHMVDKIRKYLPGAAGFSAEFPDLGITTQVLADGPAGLRISPKRRNDEKTYYCTAFPIATLLASTWDTAMVSSVGKAMGNEVHEYGADILLAPGMNIQRDPLCGRNFEYYSEDPFITGKIGASMVKGIQSNGVGTSIKHFAANNQETNRLSVNTIVSERALREIYLRGFEIAVTEAKPWTVMSSYNKINGVYTSESYDLLTKILRDDWGFEGYVMTDWSGGSNPVEQMKAGNDLIMPGNYQQVNDIISAVNEGKLDITILNKNVERILTIMLKTPRYKGYNHTNAPDFKAHAEITRQAAAEGMVLLQNNNKALPLNAGIKNIAAFGNTSYEFISGGTGSGDVNEAYTVSLTDGLKNCGLLINGELASEYAKFISETRAKTGKPKDFFATLSNAKSPVPEMLVTSTIATKMARTSDAALITIGRNSGEGGDRKAIAGDFYLNSNELSLIKTVSEAFHKAGKNVVVILNVGGVIETASWRAYPDAILCAWQPGQEAGNSVVDVLTGKVNPSGKIAVTFPLNYSDAPTAKNFPGKAPKTGDTNNAADMSGFSFMQRIPWEVYYEEDIFVGYRYYSTFNVPVAYEFGYGLSYTSFEYGKLSISSKDFKSKITASIKIKNTGKVNGREVVQVYLSTPSKKQKKAAIVLVDFTKTKLLAPGESQTFTFEIEPIDLCSFDEASSSWIAEAGTYELKVGASSAQIKSTANFNLPEEMLVKTVSKALSPQVEIKKLY